MLNVIAAALARDKPRPDSGQIDITIRFWHVAPDDALTARLAAAARYTTAPVPSDVLCPFPGAPADAPTAFRTSVTVKFVSVDTAIVILADSCRRPSPSAVGTHFIQGDSFQLVRQGGSWAIASRSFFIS